MKVLAFAAILALAYGQANLLRLNHLQVLGTENSYHIRMPDPKDQLPLWDYFYPPLNVLLENGIRSLEIDIHMTVDSNSGDLLYPVYRIPVFDNSSTCADLPSCLAVISSWMQATPNHGPIFLRIEQVVPRATSNAEWDALDNVVSNAFSFDPTRVYTPADFIGSRNGSTLQIIQSFGYPLIQDVANKIIIVLSQYNSGGYNTGYPNLVGRTMFRAVDWYLVDDPAWSESFIISGTNDFLDPDFAAALPGFISRGLLVRSRTDFFYTKSRTDAELNLAYFNMFDQDEDGKISIAEGLEVNFLTQDAGVTLSIENITFIFSFIGDPAFNYTFITDPAEMTTLEGLVRAYGAQIGDPDLTVIRKPDTKANSLQRRAGVINAGVHLVTTQWPFPPPVGDQAWEPDPYYVPALGSPYRCNPITVPLANLTCQDDWFGGFLPTGTPTQESTAAPTVNPTAAPTAVPTTGTTTTGSNISEESSSASVLAVSSFAVALALNLIWA